MVVNLVFFGVGMLCGAVLMTSLSARAIPADAPDGRSRQTGSRTWDGAVTSKAYSGPRTCGSGGSDRLQRQPPWFLGPA